MTINDMYSPRPVFSVISQVFMTRIHKTENIVSDNVADSFKIYLPTDDYTGQIYFWPFLFLSYMKTVVKKVTFFSIWCNFSTGSYCHLFSNTAINKERGYVVTRIMVEWNSPFTCCSATGITRIRYRR